MRPSTPERTTQRKQRGKALWSMETGELRGFDADFGAFFDLSPQRHLHNGSFCWQHFGNGYFQHVDTIQINQASIERLRVAIDDIKIGRANELRETDLVLISSVGRMKTLDLCLQAAPQTDGSTLLLWLIEEASTLTASPLSPPVLALALDLTSHYPVPNEPPPRAMMSKFPWKPSGTPSASKAKKAQRPRVRQAGNGNSTARRRLSLSEQLVPYPSASAPKPLLAPLE